MKDKTQSNLDGEGGVAVCNGGGESSHSTNNVENKKFLQFFHRFMFQLFSNLSVREAQLVLEANRLLPRGNKSELREPPS